MSMTITALTELTTNGSLSAGPVSVPAESITEKGTTLINDGKAMVIAGIGLLAILIGAIAGWKTKSIAGALSGFVVGALLFFAANNVSSTSVQDPIKEQLNSGGGGNG